MRNFRREGRAVAPLVLGCALLLGVIATPGCGEPPSGGAPPSGPQDLTKIRDEIPPREMPDPPPSTKPARPARR